jgi:transposase-like protein
MARGSKYSDGFAASVLAEADLSTNPSEVYERHGVPRSTYFDWLNRAESDKGFGQLRTQKRAALEREWKRHALSSLRGAFKKARELIDRCDKPEHLEFVNDHIKTVGDLAVNIEVLNDFEQGEAEAAQTQPSSPSSTRA